MIYEILFNKVFTINQQTSIPMVIYTFSPIKKLNFNYIKMTKFTNIGKNYADFHKSKKTGKKTLFTYKL